MSFGRSFHLGCSQTCESDGGQAVFCELYCACQVSELERGRTPEELEALLTEISRGGGSAAVLQSASEMCVARLLAD